MAAGPGVAGAVLWGLAMSFLLLCWAVLASTTAIVLFIGLKDAWRAEDREAERCRKLNCEMRAIQRTRDEFARQLVATRLKLSDARTRLHEQLLDEGDAVEILDGTNHHFRGTWNCEQRSTPTDGLAS